MSRPPRIANWLPLEQNTIYFVTLCVAGRKPVLANPNAWGLTIATLEKLDQWIVLGALSMPDHLHVLVTPKDRPASVSQFIKWFKRWFNDGCRDTAWVASARVDISWQEGGFDRLLRSAESASQKWEYIRSNPVRAGLVTDSDDWPYQTCLGTTGGVD